MAKGYRTRSSKGVGGTRSYTTQSPNSKPKTTMSYKTGTSTRRAVSRNGDGSVVQRTTQKMADGYTKRTTKTLVPKYKPPKPPKMPKMQNLKTSVLKEVKFKPPKPAKVKAPKASRPIKFNWSTSKKTTTKSKSKTPAGSNEPGIISNFISAITVFGMFLLIFAIIQSIFS